ncbi:MAG TPA: hypothetical protein VF848_04525, partial [Steroidobacteraceae bacterium]
AALYETAWQDGVAIAAYQLGRLYEYGAKGSDSASPDAVRPDAARAWFWYQKGERAREPHALARFAQRDESNAVVEGDPARSHSLLLEAFSYYAAATLQAKKEDWPDDACRHWQYRRATLARLLAREGMIQAVADAYRTAQVTTR